MKITLRELRRLIEQAVEEEKDKIKSEEEDKIDLMKHTGGFKD